jgi:hypothetical protein
VDSGLGDLIIGFLFPAVTDFSHQVRFQTVWGVHPASYPVCTEFLFLTAKWLEHQVDSLL